MRRRIALMIPTLAAALFATSPAMAVEIPNFVLKSFNGVSVDLGDDFGTVDADHNVGNEDCRLYVNAVGSLEVAITVSTSVSLGTGARWAVYYAAPGADCPSAMSGLDSADADCIQVQRAEDIDGDWDREFQVPFKTLLDDCTASGTARVYIYAEGESTTSPGTTQEYLEEIDIVLDVTAPNTPTITGVVGGDGRLEVTWESTSDDVDSYDVYYATSAFTDATKDTVLLKSGVDGLTTELTSGLTNGALTYVGVVAIDETGNESALSALSDGTPIETLDFWEHYQAEGGTETGGFCFVATAAYGSPMAGELNHLRRFRDQVLMASGPGRAFVHGYYSWGRFPAAWIADKPMLRSVVQVMLVPLVWLARLFTAFDALSALALMMIGAVLVREARQRIVARFAVVSTLEIR